MTQDERKIRAEVAALKKRFEQAPQRARDERDKGLRDLAAKYNLRQVDLIRLTGYSRETVRQALNPTARETVHARRKERGAQ